MAQKKLSSPPPSKLSNYWLTLEQWSKDKTFQKTAQQEFVSPPLMGEELRGLWGRREFLKLMGAAMALAGFGCVRRPAEKIVPYARRPEDITLGEANVYSSSYYDGEEGFGILVKTRGGRPIKIEGNTDHPINKGALSARAHAHLLSLYDPQRLKHPQRNLFNKDKTNKEFVRASYKEADKDIVQHIQTGRAVFLTGEWPSPTGEKLLKTFAQEFKCRHFVWNPLDNSALWKAQKLCYGEAFIPRFRLDRARVVVSLNGDFLGSWLYPTEMTRLYSKARKAGRDMNRLIVFESLMSLTGSNADWRVRIKPSQNLSIALSLMDSLRKFVEFDWPAHLPKPKPAWEYLPVHKDQWEKFVQNLWDNRGQSLIMAGGLQTQTQDSLSLQIAVQRLNHLLGNDGWTVDYKTPYRVWSHPSRNIEELIKLLETGRADTVIIHKTNPLYTYPQRDRLKAAFKKAKCIVYTGDREDETGFMSDYILPDHHDLEKWSDWEFQKGVLSVGQPTIRPLYNTRGFEDGLIAWAKQMGSMQNTKSWYAYLRNNTAVASKDWNHFLKTGVKKISAASPRSPARKFDAACLKHIRAHNFQQPGGYELSLYAAPGLKDGTLANVPWLQEFPDPVTKICWDNYVCVSPAAAKKESLKEGQLVKLDSAGGGSVSAPVHIQPGQADGVLALALGYGRKGAGRAADHVGVSGYPLARVLSGGGALFAALPVRLEAKNKFVSLACVQGHHSMEGRQIVVESVLKNYLKNPGGDIHRHKLFSLWSDHSYPKHKWGMVIDLNSCTGCSACVTACQSENNIPVVGKDLVLQGREMHWMRVDRYYKGSPQNPSAVHQPIVCMHCDNAPCETVCPVAATVHSDEGTNDMIYNRCVGTRYCSNNCPYKVRRFNWFNYAKVEKLKTPAEALNPEVTVRSRGVMEKCTFCIHRVRSAQAKAKLENRPLKDGDVQTACQQSCPAGAIVFGDLNDKSSRVYRQFVRPDAYSLLEELNTRPAVRYRVKVRNQDAPAKPLGKKEHNHG